MEHRHKTHKDEPVVLRFNKRRYDGGSEIKLIQYLEEKQRLHLTDSTKAPIKPIPCKKSASPRMKRCLSALMMGPMEIAVGAVGILTAILAISTFRTSGNHQMLEQSHAIFKDCLKALLQGFGTSFVGMGKAMKIALVG